MPISATIYIYSQRPWRNMFPAVALSSGQSPTQRRGKKREGGLSAQRPSIQHMEHVIMETTKPSSARRRAEDRFASITRRDAEVMAYQQQRWDAEAAKIARLRELRLARDAERAAQARTDAKAKPARRKRTGAASPAVTADSKATSE